MKAISNLRKALIAGGAILAMGVGSPSWAQGVFTADPNSPATGYAAPTFQADFISATTSELLTITSPTTVSGSGWAVFTAFNYQSVPLFANVTGLSTAGGYNLYLTFNLTDTLTSGTMGAPGSDYVLNSLNYTLWADADQSTTFTAANATTNTAATVNVATADVVLATGSLVSGVAGFNDQFGAFLNSLETVTLTPAGSLFFIDPVPFYSFAFDEFNNTAQGVATGTDGQGRMIISVNQATGGIDFLRVPEPSSVALIGLALAGLGFSARRGKQQQLAA